MPWPTPQTRVSPEPNRIESTTKNAVHAPASLVDGSCASRMWVKKLSASKASTPTAVASQIQSGTCINDCSRAVPRGGSSPRLALDAQLYRHAREGALACQAPGHRPPRRAATPPTARPLGVEFQTIVRPQWLRMAQPKASAMTHILGTLLDLGGTFVFAISGAVAAVKYHLDIFGVLVLAFAAGNAGGITRDVLIGATPPAAISNRPWRFVND